MEYFKASQITQLCPYLKAQITAECDSTSTRLKERSNLSDYEVLFARRQTFGRGRRGKSFLSPEGGLYFSFALKPDSNISELSLITCRAAVAAARAIEKISEKKVLIKWVNDIFIVDKKVCGILTEAKTDPKSGEMQYIIIGVGMNVFSPVGGFSEEIADIADALFSSEENGEIYCKLAAAFFEEFKALGYSDFMEEYIARSYLLGKTVQYQKLGVLHRGTVKGTSKSGSLLVEEEGKTYELISGEVSVVAQKEETP